MRRSGRVAGALRGVARAARRRRRVSGAEWGAWARALRGRDRSSVLRATVDGAVVFATLERRGLRPLVRERRDLPEADPRDARRTAEAVDAGLGVLPVAPTCLRRSVTLLRELHRLHTTAVLHIGVRPGPGGIEAHAWIEAGGEVVNDDPAVTATYVQLAAGDAERPLPRFA